MTDTVLVALINAAGTCLVAYMSYRNNRLGKENKQNILDTKAQMGETKTAIVQLKDHTNSRLDELVKTTGEAEFAKGLKQGTEAAAAESIKGETGPTGATGATGERGPAGPAGPKGEVS